MDLDTLRETALANFENLLYLWGLQYKKIGANEYDIIAKWRKDESYGGCRFNTKKARGADFAGGGFTRDELAAFGDGFDSSDFADSCERVPIKMGFDIVGLCMRVRLCASYNLAMEALEKDLELLVNKTELLEPARAAAQRRAELAQLEEKKRIKICREEFKIAKLNKFEGSVAHRYLQQRGIEIIDPINMAFQPEAQYKGGKYYPALFLRVQHNPFDDTQVGLQRIYLQDHGDRVTKANVDQPKMSLGQIVGNGVWFGMPGEVLYIAEGPETALALRQDGADFVVSTLNAGNFHNLEIPKIVHNIILVPDNDESGHKAMNRALETYKNSGATVSVNFFGMLPGEDYNDYLLRTKHG